MKAEETYFVTHAIEALQEFGGKAIEHETAVFCQTLSTLLRNSQKFRIPDYGKVLNVGDKTIGDLLTDYCTPFRLPYPIVALEYRHPECAPGGLEKFDANVVLATESVVDGELVISVYVVYRMVKNGLKKWIPCNFSAHCNGSVFSVVPTTDEGRKIEKIYGANSSVAVSDIQNELGAVISLCAALSCKNVSHFDSEAPEKLNKKRVHSGKVPFFSYKILDIHQGHSENKKLGGTHASPRCHLRRGHIRRLENKNVWVNASVVGNKKLGYVSKDYRMAE